MFLSRSSKRYDCVSVEHFFMCKNDQDLKTHSLYQCSYTITKIDAFSKFKSFNLSKNQCDNFAQLFNLPALLYNPQLWYYSCTQDECDMSLYLLTKAKTYCNFSALIEDKLFIQPILYNSDTAHIASPLFG